jgi:hypothetical protein
VSCSLGTFACLPAELLETILGFLDVRRLCTARLVSTAFCCAASRCLHQLKLLPKNLHNSPLISFDSFPKLTQVALENVRGDDLPLLSPPPLRDAITHLSLNLARITPSEVTEGLVVQLPPNLRSLQNLSYNPSYSFQFPPTLEELLLPASTVNMSAISGLTRLTRLHVNVGNETHNAAEALTTLTALQELVFGGELPVLPVVGKLTRLTHLRFEASGLRLELAPFIQLQKLVRLDIVWHMSEMTPQHFKTLGAITTLKSLHLSSVPELQGAALETYDLSPLSGLTSLGLFLRALDVPFLSKFNMEGLHRLRLVSCSNLDPDVVAVLGRATGVTELYLTHGARVAGHVPLEVGPALSRMSQLQELYLDEETHRPPTSCFKAIGLLTALTRLSWKGWAATNADVEACLGLKELRFLSIEPGNPAYDERVTRDTLLAVAELPELTRFITKDYSMDGGYPLMLEMRARATAQRHAKGWPSVEVYFM